MALNLGGVTASVVGYALDGLSLRHSAIASNIANANSIGYRPLQVSFEDALVALVDRGGAGSLSTAAVNGLPKPMVSEAAPTQLPTTENAVELQTVLLNQNVIQYQALIAGLNKYMSTVSVAINEGRK
jgi:flagellar basal-body rod protein FlgB